MLRLLTALVAGFFLGGLGLEILTDTPGVGWIWPTALPFLILGSVLTLIGRSLRGVTMPMKSDDVRTLLDANLGAIARVTSIKRTGTSVNDAPLCELGLLVAPFDRDAYTTVIRLLVDPVELPRYQPGTVVTVARLKADRPEVALVREPDADWQRRMTDDEHRIPRTAAAWNADPDQAPGSKPIIGMGAKGKGLRIAAYLALFAVGIAVVVGPNHSWVGRAVEKARTGEDYEDFVNGNRQQAVVDELVTVIGGTEVVSMGFGDDGFAQATAPTAPGKVTADDYRYRDGVAERAGPSPGQPEDLERELFDVAKIDLSMFPKLAAEARELTGIATPESESIRLAREPASGPDDKPGEVRIYLSLKDPYYSGNVTFTVDGEVADMFGGAPDSKASKSAADTD